jgi:hypothetical protein
MPSFDQLADAQVDSLVEHLRRLQQRSRDAAG